MKKIVLFIFITIILLKLHASNDLITVNNRILAKVNGKAISVFDVMKKMDMLFYRQYPEYVESIPAKFQFYQVNWKYVINDLIDKELILADALESKLPLTNGDIRQEMESLFGPNIISNLDKIGMTYDEALAIVKGDIILRRMLGYKINGKAARDITPRTIRAAYLEFIKDHEIPESFTYKVITIRDKDALRGKQVADALQDDLKNKKIELLDLVEEMKKKSDPNTLVSLTDEFKHVEKEMSDVYKETVLKLEQGQFSEVVTQKSRADYSTVFRIFYLKEKQEAGVPGFTTVENTLKEKLQNIAVEKEMGAYLKKLRDYFDVQESHLTDLKDRDFQPFSLR